MSSPHAVLWSTVDFTLPYLTSVIDCNAPADCSIKCVTVLIIVTRAIMAGGRWRLKMHC